MSLNFSAYFTEYGIPKTGLSATITVLDYSDGSVVVNGQAMTELSLGYYKYVYAGADNTKDYVARADGGAGQPQGERYVPCDSGIVGITNDIKTKTGTINWSDITSLNDITVANILDGVIEGTITVQQVLSVMLDYVAAAGEDGNTMSPKIKNIAGTLYRILYNNVDEDGDRDNCTLDFSDL